ncbi:hypothetical protein Vau01_111850 [Virgisporangium aurantiacum]|uniref:Uncharacterized protein n=1 Tax=Virgisporangium aurantiacum TaxID=175570 RepID=A0A8J4E6X3_9ACTN|nr:hypothetical protein Vau01_111850 [Virgisporangium aurantiacum]
MFRPGERPRESLSIIRHVRQITMKMQQKQSDDADVVAGGERGVPERIHHAPKHVRERNLQGPALPPQPFRDLGKVEGGALVAAADRRREVGVSTAPVCHRTRPHSR